MSIDFLDKFSIFGVSSYIPCNSVTLIQNDIRGKNFFFPSPFFVYQIKVTIYDKKLEHMVLLFLQLNYVTCDIK